MTPTEKAKKIRLVIFDVDGVLTDGKMYHDAEGHNLKAFHVHDGLGMQLLQKSGIAVAIITAKQSTIVANRMRDLNIQYVFQGQKNKLIAYEELKRTLNVSDEEVAYLGDDLPDLPVLIKVGLPATVANAPAIMKNHVSFCTKANGGEGAAREFCEFILDAQGSYPDLLKPYLEATL